MDLDASQRDRGTATPAPSIARLSIAFIVAFVVVRTFSSSYRIGGLDARMDIVRGIYAIHVGVPPTGEPGEFARILMDKYGLTARLGAGCLRSRDGTDDEEGYASVMHPEIERRLGTNIWNQLFLEEQELRQQYLERQRNQQNPSGGDSTTAPATAAKESP